MKNGLDTFLRLIRQAKDSVEVETNTDIGYQQLQTAQKIYPQAVRVNGRSFRIHVADWSARGKTGRSWSVHKGLIWIRLKMQPTVKIFQSLFYGGNAQYAFRRPF